MLRAYQDLRLPRTAETQLSSRLNQKARDLTPPLAFALTHYVQIFHLPDGPAQEARDANMRSAMLSLDQGDFVGNQNQWADRTKNDKQFGCACFLSVLCHAEHACRYDADREAERWWRETGEQEIGS